VVAVIVVAHVAGNGWAMARDWLNAGVTGGSNLAVVMSSAAVVVLAGAAAAVTGGGDVWRRVVPARPGYVVLGAAVALLVPLAWGDPEYSRDVIPLTRGAWMYSLPWGAGLAAIAWLRGRAAVVVGVTVAASAALFAGLVVGPEILDYFTRPPEYEISTPPQGD
jgi:hypothetical protein